MRIQGVAMSEAEFGPEVAREHVEAALADPALASLRLADAPVVVIAGSPGRVVYANQGAQSLFVGDLPALGRRLLLGAEPGARRVVALSRSLLPGAAPRLERLRFFFGPVAETVTVLCRRVTVAPGETLFALAVLGLRASQTTARRSGDVEPPPLKAPGDAIETKPAVSASASDATEAPAPAADSSAADLAARAPAEAEDALRQDAAPARGARFAWRTDGDHVVAFVAPALAAEIGAANADIVGRSFVDVARDMRLDADGRLAAALAARQTFAGVETSWPAGEGLVARIALGAAPAFDEEDRFDGFRGYGVVHPERLAAPATAPVAERDVATAATDEANAEAAFFAPYAAEAAGAAAPQPDIQPTAAADEDADEANDNETGLRDEAGEIVAVSDAGEPMHRGDVGAEPAGQPVDEAEPLDRHPVAVYLASLSPGSRRSMAQALGRIVEFASAGACTAESLPWASLRYAHTTAIRSMLAEQSSPATANRMLSALRGVLAQGEDALLKIEDPDGLLRQLGLISGLPVPENGKKPAEKDPAKKDKPDEKETTEAERWLINPQQLEPVAGRPPVTAEDKKTITVSENSAGRYKFLAGQNTDNRRLTKISLSAMPPVPCRLRARRSIRCSPCQGRRTRSG